MTLPFWEGCAEWWKEPQTWNRSSANDSRPFNLLYRCLQCGRPRLNPWVGKIPGEMNGNPLQSSCLQNPMDRGAWRAIVHEVTKSQAQLSNSHFHHFFRHKTQLHSRQLHLTNAYNKCLRLLSTYKMECTVTKKRANIADLRCYL